jgi:hypothetical protein
MKQSADLTGQKYGRLTIIEKAQTEGRAKYVCKCDCGTMVVVQSSNLKNGHTTSCGCARKQAASEYEYITGQIFGKLIAVKRVKTPGEREAKWICKCDCGGATKTRISNLKTGVTKSCGCRRTEILTELKTTHGGRKTRIYNIWNKMKRRCNDPKDRSYYQYGGRGISVCEEWNHSFEVFRDWAYKNGYTEELSIDRIDNDGNYCPENCRWATATTQARNRRSNTRIEFKGKVHSFAEWGEITGIPMHTLRDRILRYDWPIERALTEPVAEKYRRG